MDKDIALGILAVGLAGLLTLVASALYLWITG